MPVARHSARAPAMLRPWVEVWERYVGMVLLLVKPAPAGQLLEC